MKKYDGLNQAMVERFAPRPGRHALLPEMSAKAQAALMCRMMFREGWNEHIAGHITWRQSDGTILTNPWELAWDELTASDIMTLDAEGNITGAHCGLELPVYNEYSGTFEDEATTLSAAEALGDSKWALLANHGALVVGKDLRQAHLRVITLEWRCKRAYEVELLGGAEPLSDEVVEKVSITDGNGFPFCFEAMARRELRLDPSILE